VRSAAQHACRAGRRVLPSHVGGLVVSRQHGWLPAASMPHDGRAETPAHRKERPYCRFGAGRAAPVPGRYSANNGGTARAGSQASVTLRDEVPPRPGKSADRRPARPFVVTSLRAFHPQPVPSRKGSQPRTKQIRGMSVTVDHGLVSTDKGAVNTRSLLASQFEEVHAEIRYAGSGDPS
jgi:hypothetical protein